MTILGGYLLCSVLSLTAFAIKRQILFKKKKGMKVPIIAVTIHFQLFMGWQMDLIHPHTSEGGKATTLLLLLLLLLGVYRKRAGKRGLAARRESKRAAGGFGLRRTARPLTPPPSPPREGRGGSSEPALIDTCNEETLRERPGPTGPELRSGRLSGAQVTGPEAPRHHAPSRPLGPPARRLLQAAAAPDGRGAAGHPTRTPDRPPPRLLTFI